MNGPVPRVDQRIRNGIEPGIWDYALPLGPYKQVTGSHNREAGNSRECHNSDVCRQKRAMRNAIWRHLIRMTVTENMASCSPTTGVSPWFLDFCCAMWLRISCTRISSAQDSSDIEPLRPPAHQHSPNQLLRWVPLQLDYNNGRGTIRFSTSVSYNERLALWFRCYFISSTLNSSDSEVLQLFERIAGDIFQQYNACTQCTSLLSCTKCSWRAYLFPEYVAQWTYLGLHQLITCSYLSFGHQT